MCNLWGCERGYILGEDVEGKGDWNKTTWSKGEGPGSCEWRVMGAGSKVTGEEAGRLLRCQKCREVVYCCKEHQVGLFF